MPVAGAVMVWKFTSVNSLKKVKKGPIQYLPWIYDSRSFFTVICSQHGINSHFSESLFMAKSPLETCTSLDIACVCLWKSFLYQPGTSLWGTRQQSWITQSRLLWVFDHDFTLQNLDFHDHAMSDRRSQNIVSWPTMSKNFCDHNLRITHREEFTSSCQKHFLFTNFIIWNSRFTFWNSRFTQGSSRFHDPKIARSRSDAMLLPHPQGFAFWFINQSDESVISIYNHYWWWIVFKICEIPMESWKQVKLTFFSRIIHVNLKDFFGQIISTLKGSQCVFDIHPYLNSNWI